MIADRTIGPKVRSAAQHDASQVEALKRARGQMRSR